MRGTSRPLPSEGSGVCHWLFHADAIDAPDFDPSDAVESFDLVNRQDRLICGQQQPGTASRAYRDGGYFFPTESHLRGFDDWVPERLAEWSERWSLPRKPRTPGGPDAVPCAPALVAPMMPRRGRGCGACRAEGGLVALRTRDDRGLLATRLTAIGIIPVLGAAFFILYLFPDDTAERWSWPIQPRMSPMMLGATYLGGAHFFVRALFARSWHTFGIGLLGVFAFASILGVSTIIHWDRFTHDSLAFVLWTALYFTLPLPLFGLWWWDSRFDPGATADDPCMPRLVRQAVTIGGGGLVLVAVLLFAWPDRVGGEWPWTLTPLVARVMSAMLVLPGAVSVGIGIDGRWGATGILLEAEAVAVGFILLAIPIASDSFDWGSVGSWFFVLGMTAFLGAVIGLRFAAYYALRDARPTASSL